VVINPDMALSLQFSRGAVVFGCRQSLWYLESIRAAGFLVIQNDYGAQYCP
jgi:hypothetical protein